jgi:hypothetical protein
MVVAAHAQTTVVPEQPAAPGQVKSFDSQHLTQRPYDASLPKPIFPSTPREQKEFTVRYIYDYAESTYSPPAALPTVTKLQFDRSTPEGAMTAFVSTMQEGDYDGWLQCWDEESRKAFTDAAKTGKQDAAYWKKVWQTAVAGRTITLDYRLELVGYVILDARMAMPGKPPSELFPTVFKNVSGKWLATTGLGTSIFLGDWRPGVAGIDNRVTPQPLAGATGGWVQQAEAQQQFLKQHATRSEVVQAAQ